MNKHKWSEDEISYFVHLYRSHECLWNVRDPSYSIIPIRAAAFKDIAEKMLQNENLDGLGTEEIKEKICKLKSTYYQLKKRYSFSSVCPSERTGRWYKDMDFIIKNSRLNKDRDTYNLDDDKPVSTNKSKNSEVNASSSAASGNVHEDPLLLHEETLQAIHKTMPVHSIKLISRIAIMNVLKKLYMENVSPSYNIVFDILNKIIQHNDPELTADIHSFKHGMTKLGYMLKETIDGKNILIENSEQRFERYIYLNKIKKIRTNRIKQIVYIDERVINFELKYERLSMPKGLPPQSSLFFLAITRDGLLNGLFSNQATEEQFSKWIIDIILDQLKTPSVIVMDNSPIHGASIDTCSITRYSTKSEMFKWLISNNIPCSINISRPDMFELVRMNRRETKEYKIDKIIKSHGHEVLRLPDGFTELNMTDVLWNAFSEGKFISMKKLHALTSLPALQNKIIESMLPSLDKKKWHELEKTLAMKETEIHSIDVVVENILENYVFM